MSEFGMGKAGGTAFSWSSVDRLTNVEPGGYTGRACVSIRISATGDKLGFAGTILEEGWVTVETRQELPHANIYGAQQEAQSTALGLALAGIDKTLEALLVKVREPEGTSSLLTALLADPGQAVQAGFPEPLVRALVASPGPVWASLTDEEKEALRRCYEE